MSEINYQDRPQRSVSQRWRDVWDHPTPFGLIAYIKALTDAANSVPDLMASAGIAAGSGPSTEAEAMTYNQARDYLSGAAFNVARALSPTLPRAVGGITIRPIGGSAPHVQARPGPASASEMIEGGRSLASRDLPKPNSRVDFNPYAVESDGAPPAAVLRSNPTDREIPAGPGLIQPERTTGNPLAPAPQLTNQFRGQGEGPASDKLSPDFRQLTRVPPSSQRPAGSNIPLPGIESPPLVPDQQPASGESSPEGGGTGSGGGTGGSGGSGDDDNERRKACTEQWIDEKQNWCPQFRVVDPRYQRECEDKAYNRLTLCHGNAPQISRFDWKDIDHGDLMRFRKAEAKRRAAKSRKKR